MHKILRFAAALADHILRGAPTVPPAVQEARLAACRSNRCGQYRTRPVESCADCGCLLGVKTKWAEQACPLGIWGAEVDVAGAPVVPPAVPHPPCGGCPGAG